MPTAVIRNANDEICYFAERAEGIVLQPGQTLAVLPEPFEVYAARLRLSAGGVSGETLFAPLGGTPVMVEVWCPGWAEVALEVNGDRQVVALTDGRGGLTIDCAAGGVHIIQPADRTVFAACGAAVLVVVVRERTPPPG